jgi:hypothetical protein
VDFADIASTADADVQSTFKRVYLKAVDAVPDATPLTAQMNRTQKFKAGPDGLYFNAKTETGGAVANVPDGKILPRATGPKRKQGKVGLAHTYTVVGVGGQSIPLTENTRNAFVSNLEDNLEDGMTRVKNDVERQYNGDGRGILAVLLTVGGAPVYGVEKPYGLAGGGPGTMLLIEDMDVAIINPGNGVERDRGKITVVNPAGGTDGQFTADAAFAGAVIGDYVVLCNDSALVSGTVDAVNNYLNEAAGILAVAASGDTFENIDGATVRRWNGTSIDFSGGGPTVDLTEERVARLEETVRAKSGKTGQLLYTTRGIRIVMQKQLATLRRYDGADNPIKGGYDGLEINGRTVLVGDWCPKQQFFSLSTDKDAVGMVDLVPMGYVDLDGAKLHRVEGRHAYRADLWFPHQAIWFLRNCVGRGSGLTDDKTIIR